MKFLGTSWHVLIVSLLVSLVAGVHVTAWACSLAPAPRVASVLGTSFTRSLPDDPILPRNFAIVSESRGSVTLADGSGIAFSPIDGVPDLLRAEGVVAGAMVQALGELPATVEDVVDTTPPSAATVTGGRFNISDDDSGFGCQQGGGTCGEVITLTVDITPGSDDHTPVEQLSYALFVGSSEAAVMDETTAPEGFFVRDFGDSVWRFASEDEGDRDIWVTVATVDLAGNFAPRAMAMQIHSGGSGCAVSRRSSWSMWMLAALVGALVWRRRRRLMS